MLIPQRCTKKSSQLYSTSTAKESMLAILFVFCTLRHLRSTHCSDISGKPLVSFWMQKYFSGPREACFPPALCSISSLTQTCVFSSLCWRKCYMLRESSEPVVISLFCQGHSCQLACLFCRQRLPTFPRMMSSWMNLLYFVCGDNIGESHERTRLRLHYVSRPHCIMVDWVADVKTGILLMLHRQLKWDFIVTAVCDDRLPLAEAMCAHQIQFRLDAKCRTTLWDARLTLSSGWLVVWNQTSKNAFSGEASRRCKRHSRFHYPDLTHNLWCHERHQLLSDRQAAAIQADSNRAALTLLFTHFRPLSHLLLCPALMET